MDETTNKTVTLDAGPGKQPLYAALATELKKEIEAGKYTEGSIFPSEKELTERYTLSRQTVREALRILREQGLISSHPGVGTTVRALGQKPTFSPMNSVESLLSFVENTQMHATGVQVLMADESLSEQLECPVGTPLSCAGFLRKLPNDKLPMSYVLIYVKPRYAAAQLTTPISNSPIYKNIEAMFGVRVHEIRQDISAINLNAELAEILQAKEGDPALLMKRFYFDINNKLIQSSLSYYPGDRYTQSSRFRATTSNSN